NFFALARGFDGAFGVKVQLAGGGAGTGRQPPGNALRTLDRLAIEHGREDLVELVGRDAADGRFPVNQLFLLHLDGETDGGEAGALAVASLKHEHFAILDRELEVLNVLEMTLQRLSDLLQFGIGVRHLLLELRYRFGRPHARYHIFALPVDQELAVENLSARRRIARERDARSGIVTRVAIDHRLDINRRAPLGGNVVFAAIDNGAVVHPGSEHGANRAPKLFPRVLWKLTSGALFDQGFEPGNEFLEVVRLKHRVLDVGAVTFVLQT